MPHPQLGPRIANALPVALLVAALGACSADQAGLTAPDAAARAGAALADVADETTPGAHALGGAITMAPNEHQFLVEEMHPTGIRLPQGLPVRFVASGEIGRTSTAGFLDVCIKLAPFCEKSEEVQAMLHTPLPPWGDTTWFGERRGYAQLWWEGPGDADGNTIVFSQDQPVIRTTWRGGELWVGHTFWECYWTLTDPHDYSQTHGDCFDMSGQWTIAVVPDDGSETDPKTGLPVGGTAVLTAALTGKASTPTGLHVAARASAKDGSPLTGQHWYWVPDQATGLPPMAVASARSASLSSTTAITHEASSTLPLRLAPVASRATTARNATTARTSAVSSSAAEQPLTSCEYQSQCVADVEGLAGKLVVEATVNGQKYSAEAQTGAEPTLSCPDEVQRGETGKCEITGASAPTVVMWRFQPDDASLDPIELGGDAATPVWAGTFVTSGNVTVTVKSGGKQQQLGPQHIAVTARGAWPPAPDTVEWTWKKIDQGLELPPRPTAFEKQLGKTKFGPVLVPDAIGFVNEGPNDGLAYMKKIPARMEFEGMVNLIALTKGSDFYDAQSTGNLGSSIRLGGPTPCVTHDFPRYVAAIWVHEGDDTRPKDSHVDTVLREWNRLMHVEAESVVFATATADSFLDGKFKDWNARADKYSESITDAPRTNPLNRTVLGKCEFNFVY